MEAAIIIRHLAANNKHVQGIQRQVAGAAGRQLQERLQRASDWSVANNPHPLSAGLHNTAEHATVSVRTTFDIHVYIYIYICISTA